MSAEYDIIVMGGGPAGLEAAGTAAAEGAKVLLLELQAQIGGQTQTSAWLPAEELEKGVNQAVTSEVKKINLNSVHDDLQLNGDFGEIIDRKVFDKLLASEAAEKGVDIWLSSPIRELLEENGRINGVRAEAGGWAEEVKSEIVLDATGAKTKWSSLFMKKVLNSTWKKEKTTQTNEYLMTNVPGESRIDLYFNSILAPGGHAWIYPGERKFGIAGIQGVRIHPDSALDEFIGREEPERLRESAPIGAYRGQMPIEGPLEKTTSDGIMAVGASAGQTYPLSGHGIKYALKAGSIAGEVAAESVREEDVSNERLSDYDGRWKNEFGKELQAGKMLSTSLETSPDQKMDSMLKVLKKNPELQKDFVNVFLGENLSEALNNLFENEELTKIFGKKKIDKILSSFV